MRWTCRPRAAALPHLLARPEWALRGPGLGGQVEWRWAPHSPGVVQAGAPRSGPVRGTVAGQHSHKVGLAIAVPISDKEMEA